MQFEIIIAQEASNVLAELDRSDPNRAARVRATFGKMQMNIRSGGLRTHAFTGRTGPNGEKLFEAYVENNTPNAHRVIWYYGPGQGIITVITVIPHH